MTLAGMIRSDEDALICDLAETYGVYDYKLLPARQVAIFSSGLREDSRIKRKISGEKISKDLFLRAIIADRLGIICYRLGFCVSGKPPSILKMLLGIADEGFGGKSDVVAFDSPEEFDKAWKGGGD